MVGRQWLVQQWFKEHLQHLLHFFLVTMLLNKAGLGDLCFATFMNIANSA
jgi:hypothetical protein